MEKIDGALEKYRKQKTSTTHIISTIAAAASLTIS